MLNKSTFKTLSNEKKENLLKTATKCSLQVKLIYPANLKYSAFPWAFITRTYLKTVAACWTIQHHILPSGQKSCSKFPQSAWIKKEYQWQWIIQKVLFIQSPCFCLKGTTHSWVTIIPHSRYSLQAEGNEGRKGEGSSEVTGWFLQPITFGVTDIVVKPSGI